MPQAPSYIPNTMLTSVSSTLWCVDQNQPCSWNHPKRLGQCSSLDAPCSYEATPTEGDRKDISCFMFVISVLMSAGSVRLCSVGTHALDVLRTTRQYCELRHTAGGSGCIKVKQTGKNEPGLQPAVLKNNDIKPNGEKRNTNMCRQTF